MRVVVQRVKEASVTRQGDDGEVLASIGPGLLCLVGISTTDGPDDAAFCRRKILNGRLWQNEETGKPWDLSVTQVGGEVLLVSNFTLEGSFKGNKPTWHLAMPPEEARAAFHAMVEALQRDYNRQAVQMGEFGAMMDVRSCNDGPVSMVIDTKQRSGRRRPHRRPGRHPPPKRSESGPHRVAFVIRVRRKLAGAVS